LNYYQKIVPTLYLILLEYWGNKIYFSNYWDIQPIIVKTKVTCASVKLKSAALAAQNFMISSWLPSIMILHLMEGFDSLR
jgi:hypothetical protein